MNLPQKYLDAIGENFENYIPPSWDIHFMRLVYETAKKSKDTKTKIAAIIVGKDNESLISGFNGLPRKVNDNKKERYERPKKYLYTEHGERNCVYTASRLGIALKETKMYTNSIPCCDCGRAIIQSGISEVIIHEPFELISRHLYNNWTESSNTTIEMFQEAGVKLRTISEFIDVIGYVNGKIINV